MIIDLAEGLVPGPRSATCSSRPIEILISTVRGDSVKLGLTADPRFGILRDELCEEPAAVYEVATGR